MRYAARHCIYNHKRGFIVHWRNTGEDDKDQKNEGDSKTEVVAEACLAGVSTCKL